MPEARISPKVIFIGRVVAGIPRIQPIGHQREAVPAGALSAGHTRHRQDAIYSMLPESPKLLTFATIATAAMLAITINSSRIPTIASANWAKNPISTECALECA
jgi:hypothetical protein